MARGRRARRSRSWGSRRPVRELRATAAGTVDAPPEACLALLADVGAYPRWCPQTVRRAEALERDSDGHPTRARITLRLGLGPLAGSFDELMVLRVDAPDRVSLARVPHEPTDPERVEVTWRGRPALGAAARGPGRVLHGGGRPGAPTRE